ncbi:MAG TPA: PaaI family thioesterase [Alphaproteobacteria bacterium]|nr:PaaI family thioesterase [Alphaproteobacteria bacterium]
MDKMPVHEMTADKMTVREFNALVERDLPLARWLGFSAEAIGEGKATIRLPFRKDFVRPGGTIAGPAMMALADCAMYAAVLGARGDAIMAVTSNLSIHFLRAPKPVDMVAEAELLRMGRRLAVVEVTLYSAGDEKPVAHIAGTYALPSQASGEGFAVP